MIAIKKYTRRSDEELQLEALKYENRKDFEKYSFNYYQCAYRKGMEFLNRICSHMSPLRHEIWTNEDLCIEALKYTKRSEFKAKNDSAYQISRRKGKIFLDSICSHMDLPLNRPYTDEELALEAKKYSSISEFQKKGKGASKAAYNRGREFFDSICSHMPSITNTSSSEKELLGEIRKIFLDAKKHRITKLKIENLPFIRWFELDIYVPSLNRGIEFDGIWSHSFDGLKRGRPHWSDEGLLNYHEIKDAVFSSKGIEILHISELDWNLNKESCIQKCLDFLRGENVEQAA